MLPVYGLLREVETEYRTYPLFSDNSEGPDVPAPLTSPAVISEICLNSVIHLCYIILTVHHNAHASKAK